MTEAGHKYWAFISYSHADEAWAKWLHQSIETYRVPRHLVGRKLGDETVPRRLFPVFRDRDELPSSHELGAVINRALAGSRNLVVICSPRSATSRWVNEEIKAFRALGRSHRVFCLIVDGEPHASQRPDIAFSECFPPALREEGFEPIAADARERKDGKAAARLKLLAGLIDVGYDELRQREKQRQLRQRVVNTLGALAVIGALAGSWQWFMAQRAEREREIRIEKLVEGGRLELKAGQQARAAVLLNEARRAGDQSIPVKFMLGQAMQPVEALTKVQVRHGGVVRKAAFSDDGTRFVLIVEEKENHAVAKIYDAESGRELRVLPHAPPAPRSIQFLRDTFLVTGYDDTDLNNPVTCLWKLDSSDAPVRIAGFNGHFGKPVDAAGERFLVATAKGVEIRSTADGRILATRAAGRAVAAAAFGPGPHDLAYAASDGVIHFEQGPGAAAVLRDARGQQVYGVTFTPSGDRLMALSRVGDARVWLRDSSLSLAFAVDSDWIHDLAFDASGRRFVTLGSQGFSVWSLARGSLLLKLAQSVQRGASAALSPDGATVYLADAFSSTAEAWDVLGKRKLYSLDHHSGSVTTIGLDASGRRLIVGSRDGLADIWNTALKPLWRHQTFDMPPYMARFSPDGSRVIVGRGDFGRGDAVLLAASDGRQLAHLPGHRAMVMDAAFDSSGERVATASFDGTAILWTADDAIPRSTLKHEGFTVASVAFTPDARRVLTSARLFRRPGGYAALWKADDGSLIAKMEHSAGLSADSMSQDGLTVATGSFGGDIVLFDGEDGKRRHSWKAHDAEITAVRFSRDGRRLVTSGLDNRVRVWNVSSGALLHSLDERALALPQNVAWSPGDREIAIATRAGNVWLWGPEGDRRQTLKGHQQAVTGLAWSADGRILVSHSMDGTVLAWDATRGSELGTLAYETTAITMANMDRAEEHLVATSWGQTTVWNSRLEERAPEALVAILRCSAPWVLAPDGIGLVQSATPETCRNGAQ